MFYSGFILRLHSAEQCSLKQLKTFQPSIFLQHVKRHILLAVFTVVVLSPWACAFTSNRNVATSSSIRSVTAREYVLFWEAVLCLLLQTWWLAELGLAAGQPGYYVIQQNITLENLTSPDSPDGTFEMPALYSTADNTFSLHSEHNVLNLPHI